MLKRNSVMLFAVTSLCFWIAVKNSFEAGEPLSAFDLFVDDDASPVSTKRFMMDLEDELKDVRKDPKFNNRFTLQILIHKTNFVYLEWKSFM